MKILFGILLLLIFLFIFFVVNAPIEEHERPNPRDQ